MMVMKVLVAIVMMMISMKCSSMMLTMAMISPLREGISPADFYLRRAFSLCVFSTPQRQWSISVIPPGFRFSGR
jgi:hypothetical protein